MLLLSYDMVRRMRAGGKAGRWKSDPEFLGTPPTSPQTGSRRTGSRLRMAHVGLESRHVQRLISCAYGMMTNTNTATTIAHVDADSSKYLYGVAERRARAMHLQA